MKHFARSLVWLVAAATLTRLFPAPSAVLAPAGPGPDGALGPVLAVVALLAWAGSAWLLLLAALAQLTALPGVLGRTARAVLRRVAPVAVRRLLEVTLGLTLATGTVAGLAAPALADPRPPVPTTQQLPTLDWPSAVPVVGPVVTASAPPATVPAPVRHQVTVATGDTLWGLARQALGPAASNRQVAQTWPSWWQANRHVIGTDPSVLHPGEVLTSPETPETTENPGAQP